jgi:hypothetical protein
MQIKVMLNLTAKNLGATGGTAYSDPFLLKGMLDVASLATFLHAAKTAGTTPTLDVSLEYSWDGTHWYATGLAFTQVTTSANSDESKMWGSNKIGPRIRVKYVIGGTATPAYDIWVAISAFATGYWE